MVESYTNTQGKTLKRVIEVNFVDFALEGKTRKHTGRFPENISLAPFQQILEVLNGPLQGLCGSCIGVVYESERWLKAKLNFIPILDTSALLRS